MRSGILDKFKEAFDKALNGGEGFSSAANKCIEFYMAQFDEGCAGIEKSVYPFLLDINRLKLNAQYLGKEKSDPKRWIYMKLIVYHY